jgi:predicted ferric reductase
MRRFFVVVSALSLLLIAVAVANPTRASASSIPKSLTFAATDSPNILVSPIQGPAVSKQLEARAKTSWPWYVTRAAGFLAAISLVLLILSGIGFITGTSFRFLEPLTAWATHKAIAYIFAISGTIHVIALLFDKYVPFTIAQALVPFLSHYRQISIAGHHFGSLYVALGVFSLYFVLAIILTSIFWMDKKPHTWKIFHFLSYLTIVFVFFHALYLGTDLAHGVFRVIWIVLGILIAIAIVYRLKRRAKVE